MRDPTCQVIDFNIAGRYCQLGLAPCVSLEREIDFVTTPMSRNPCLKWAPHVNNDVYEDISFESFPGSSVFLVVARVRIRKK